ncbi:hypothetical protein FACS189449_11980 [Alphaproteobacteria bacterium]|nr:hypothetical protein FACS189449_11980 [Alphaproteobacteria bacterium]
MNKLEEYNYFINKTWDSSKTLADNQKILVDTFMKTCLDFSFRVTKKEGVNVFWGATSSQSNILMLSQSKEKSAAPIPIPPRTIVNILDSDTVSSTSLNEETKIRSTIEMISKVPIGCKLLRTLITKCEVNHYKKLVVIPTGNGEIQNSISKFFFEILQMLGTPIKKEEDLPPREVFLEIPDDIAGQGDSPVAFFDAKERVFIIKPIRLSADVLVFHELVHWLHILDGHADTDLKTSEVTQKRFWADKKPASDATETLAKYNNKLALLIPNDEENRTILGLSRLGLDSLCEAAYTVSAYRYVRLAHSSAVESDVETKTFISDFLEKYPDGNLLNHYLKNGAILPKFGVSRYKCADIPDEIHAK